MSQFCFQNLQEKAEQLVKDYVYNDTLLLPQVDYLNMNDLQNTTDEFEANEHFGRDVLDETAGVHIPIEIYEGCK